MSEVQDKTKRFPAGARLFSRMFTRLGCNWRPPQFEVDFFAYASLTNTIRLREDAAQVRLSDVLQDAPAGVIEAAAAILLSRLFRRRTPEEMLETYREFLMQRRTQEKLSALRRKRTRPIRFHPHGDHHDLRPLFDRLNRRYFAGRMKAPKMGWSARTWRSQLGCYDPAWNQIVISSALDRERVPRHVVEYVLYHEMLHMKHPVKRAACGLSAHSADFRKEERRFKDYERARRFLARAV